MNELELKSDSVVHTDSSRRKFVTKLLGGAAVAAPVIAALTAGASKATPDKILDIYQGLNLFEAPLFDAVTGVSGLATFEIAVNEALALSPITYTLALSNPHAKTNGGVLVHNGHAFLYLPIGTPAAIELACYEGASTFITLLEDFIDSSVGITILVSIPVTLHGVSGNLIGTLSPAPNAQRIFAESIVEGCSAG